MVNRFMNPVTRGKIATPLAWAGILGITLFLVFFRLGHESLGFDESYTLAAIQWPVGDLVAMIAKDSHPPLYFIGLKGFTALFGLSPESARSWSAVWAFLLVGLGFFPLRKWWGERRGMIYSLVCLACPMTVIMGQDARMYMQGAFLVTLAFLLCHRIWMVLQDGRTASQGLWSGFSLTCIAAAWTHYYALMAVIVLWIALLVSLVTRWKGKSARLSNPSIATSMSAGKALRTGLIWGGICLAAYSPWIAMMLGQAARIKQHYWIEAPNAGTLLDALMMPWNFKYSLAFPSFMLMPLAWALILGRTFRFAVSKYHEALLSDARRLMAAGGSKETLNPGDTAGGGYQARVKNEIFAELVPGLGPALIYIAVLAAAMVISLAYRPVLVQRYMVPCLGLMCLSLSWALDRLMIFHPRQSKALILVFITCGALVLSRVYVERYSGSMTESVEWLETQIKPEDVFIHASEHTLGTFAWYFPGYRHYFYMKPGTVPYSNYEVFRKNSTWGGDLAPLLAQEHPIWFTWVEFQDYFIPLKTILDDPRWTFASRVKGFGIETSWYNPEIIGFRRIRPGERPMDLEAIMKE